MSVVSDLIKLGFAPARPDSDDGDFRAQDDSDGRGTYIREWLSKDPCPFPELIREPIGQEPVEPEA